MSIFNSIARHQMQLGLSENDDYFCLVINDNHNFSMEWRAKPCCPKQFIEEMVGADQKFTFIRTVPYQYIWRKNFCVPRTYPRRIILSQILQMLSREIPLPFTEINLDFETIPIENNPLQRVHCHALRKSYADQLSLYEETVLDCELYAFLRGFIHHGFQHQDETRYLIKDKVVQFSEDGVSFDNDLSTATWRPDPPEHTPDGSYFDETLFLMALGASVWDLD